MSRAFAGVPNLVEFMEQRVLTIQKWWSSGAGDPRCELYIVMGKTSPYDESVSAHRQQSVVLVPARTLGVTVRRMLSVFGYDDAPHGHGHITFENVRIPATNMVLGEGRGFEIIQGRLGPGRIHHAMRCIGAVRPTMWSTKLRLRSRLTSPRPSVLLI